MVFQYETILIGFVEFIEFIGLTAKNETTNGKWQKLRVCWVGLVYRGYRG